MNKEIRIMFTKFTIFGSVLLSLCFICGCNDSLLSTPKNTNMASVMKEGDRIVVTNTFGTLTIIAGRDNTRYLTLSGKDKWDNIWSGNTVCVKLAIGNFDHHNSSLTGLFCDTNVKKISYENGDGYTRVKMKESQLHFDNLGEAKRMLDPNAYDECRNPELWSSTGLYVYFNPVVPEYWVFPRQNYLYVELFQIYINGNKPENLPYAKNDKIKVEHLTDEQLAKFEKSVKRWW